MASSFSLQLMESIGPLLVAVAIGLVVLAIRLYATRGKLDAGSGVLLGLRVTCIALVIFLLLDPVLSLFAERSVPARIALLLDSSLSMAIPLESGGDAAGQIAAGTDAPSAAETAATSGKTRSDRMVELLSTSGGDLLRALDDRGDLEGFRFGGGVEPLPLSLDHLGDELEPRGDRTDLSRALTDAVGTERRRTGAVVLVSDGSHNVGVDPREAARRLGVPVYAIGVGAEGPVTDLSVFDVAASNVAYLDNDVPVKARLRARGDAASGVSVYLSEGDTVLDSLTVDLPGNGAEREVEFQYVPTTEGMHRYRVWVPERDGEISGANNQHPFVVRVLKEKIRVLLVTSRPSFDFTFLKRALESDVSLSVDCVVLSAAAFPGRLGRSGPAFPDAYAELAPYDLVILLDTSREDVEPSKLENVARFVRERGGALLIMGPPRAFDLSGTALADLLPVVLEPGLRSRTGQILAGLTPSGRTHPVTQVERDPDVNQRIWDELPPLHVAPIFTQRRADARVLVEGRLQGGTRNELPLVATRSEGNGRVLMIAGSPYWRWDLYLWGTGRSGDVFRRFVSRSVRWLVSRDDLKAVSIRPGKSLFEGADEVVVEGQVFDDDFRPVPGADVRASVRGPLGTSEERVREISLVDLGEGRYRGTVPGLPPGNYGVEGTARLGGADLGDDRSEMTVAPFRMEFEDPAPNFALLRDVTRESGGRFLMADEAETLPDLLDLDPVVERSARELPFVENPLFFLALLGLLGSEWALRRRRGLP